MPIPIRVSDPVTGNAATIRLGAFLKGNDGAPGSPGAPGTQGPQGNPGRDAVASTFVFSQPTPAALWAIAHNLGRFPSVTLTDLAGNSFTADVQFINANVIHINLSVPVAGVAYLD